MISVSCKCLADGGQEDLSDMPLHKIRPRSFQSFEQVDMLIHPESEEISMRNGLEKTDFLEFKRPGDWGSFLGYEV
jgi:hypothetical protein